MLRVGTALLGLVALTSAASAADQSYLCVGDLSTGFIWKDGDWQPTTFHVRNSRFVVAVTGLEIEVTRIGDNHPSHTCRLHVADAVQAACGGLGMGFVVNFETLRFQETYGFGYVDAGDSPDNTPSITIGKCSPF